MRIVSNCVLKAIHLGVMSTLFLTATYVPAQQKTMAPRESLTKVQFDDLFKQLSNWGRWGKDDQFGTLNLITPARKREAAALVKAGVSVSLARDLNAEKAVDNPDPFRDTMTLGVDDKFNMDAYTVNFHGFAFSHFDALSHTYYDGHLYNGFPDTVITSAGAGVLDTVQYRNGIFTRGVLIDIPWLRGLPYLEKDGHISAADLDAWETKTGVRVHSGDAVPAPRALGTPGCKGAVGHFECIGWIGSPAMAWLRKRDAAFLVSDAAHDARSHPP